MKEGASEGLSRNLEGLLSRVMLVGVLLAAAVLLVGGGIYLMSHGQDAVGDHIFTGEPAKLRHPMGIVEGAMQVHPRALIQLGVLLLLLNPILRIFLAGVGYVGMGNWTYVVVCLILLAVLGGSFLGG